VTDGLLADTRLYIDRQTWSPHKAFIFYFVRMPKNYVLVEGSPLFTSDLCQVIDFHHSKADISIGYVVKYRKTNIRNCEN